MYYGDGTTIKQISGINKIPHLTQAQYEALNVKPSVWIRTDAPNSYKRLSADQVSPKIVLSIPANTYASWTLALTAIRTAFQTLTAEEQKRAVILQGTKIFHQNLDGIFDCVRIGSSNTIFITIYITSSQIYFGNMTTNESGSRFYDDSSLAQDQSLALVVY